jgi:hypothetical protein
MRQEVATDTGGHADHDETRAPPHPAVRLHQRRAVAAVAENDARGDDDRDQTEPADQQDV